MGHFNEYSVPGVKPKVVVLLWLIASGANGNRPPVSDDCAIWPPIAEAEIVYAVAILGSIGRKFSGTFAEATTLTNR